MINEGCWEFNARPYSAYTTMALLILEEMGEDDISLTARQVRVTEC